MLSDEQIERIIDRSRTGCVKANSSSDDGLIEGTALNAADFDETAPMPSIRELCGQDMLQHCNATTTLKSIGQAWKRSQAPRSVSIDRYNKTCSSKKEKPSASVPKGSTSVPEAIFPETRQQLAGRDYSHVDFCQSCVRQCIEGIVFLLISLFCSGMVAT